jgi:hypothetical protein
MRFLGGLRKRGAIRGYARKLPRMLRTDYGFSHSYTPQQVRATIERYGLNHDHSVYALAMFSGPEGFAQFHESTGERYNYEAMRDAVALYYFNGNTNFTVSDIMHAFPDAAYDTGGSGWSDGADGHGGHRDGSGGH